MGARSSGISQGPAAAPAQAQQQAAPAMAQNQYYGGNMFGINNQQIQDAIANWQQQQNPEQVETPPAVEEPPPPTATETGPVGFQDDGILGALYGSNSSYSDRFTNGLNYAQAPTYAPNPKSKGSLEFFEEGDEGMPW